MSCQSHLSLQTFVVSSPVTQARGVTEKDISSRVIVAKVVPTTFSATLSGNGFSESL
ncbi:hypothetical protein Fmac_032179 [Flemingia macrophylla]|uniref:Uncharacterized protein n=1 Tax=Flemingia macrophylla TaxID=520843 RepID=A0ABD1L4K6_9FABA